MVKSGRYTVVMIYRMRQNENDLTSIEFYFKMGKELGIKSQ